MKSIKCFAVITLIFWIGPESHAITKVIDRNYKNQPEWIGVTQADYLVANGEGVTLDEAKTEAHNSLKKLVANIVVDQMKDQNTYFKSIDIETENAKKLFKKSAYYSHLDDENPNDFYWERLKNTDTKSKIYRYYLKYHLNNQKMEKAIDEIAFDHELTITLESAKEQLHNFYKVQDIDEVYKKLMFLNARLTDEDQRKEECENVLAIITDNYNNVEIKEILNVPGKLIVCQTINNKAILTLKPPKVTSQNVKITNIENFEEQWIIDYKYYSYRKSTSDFINVEFDNAIKTKSREIEIDTKGEKIEVKLTGAPIVISRKKMIKIYLISTYRGDVVLDRVILRYNDLNYTDTKINQLLDGAGLYTIRYLTPPGFFRVKVSDKVSGELHYISKKTGQKEIYRFYNQQLSIQ